MNTRVLEQGSKEYIFVVGMFAMLVDDFNCSPREIMALCKKVMCDNFPSFMEIYNENKEGKNEKNKD